jgi:ferritin-like protein
LPDDQGDINIYRGNVLQCPRCAWWTAYYYHFASLTGKTLIEEEVCKGIVYEFDIQPMAEPLTVLRRLIAERQMSLRDLTPRQLERLVGSVFRDFMQCQVTHIGGPGDHGVDLLLVHGAQRAIVQVKRRKRQGLKEGVGTVRDLLGALLLSECKTALLVSTADDFSCAAKDAVSVARELCAVDIELYDQQRLREVLELTQPPSRPWASAVPWAKWRSPGG